MKTEFRKVTYMEDKNTESFPLDCEVHFDTIGIYTRNENNELVFISEIPPAIFAEITEQFFNQESI